MNVEQFVTSLLRDRRFGSMVTTHREINAAPGLYRPLPDELHPSLSKRLFETGLGQLYSHQADAYSNVRRQRNIVVVTPTSSGKTLCYNLPVLQSIIENPGTRAIYLFPTKALAHDQRDELAQFVPGLPVKINANTYDGDTPQSARRIVRDAGHIVITNPDMLHAGILPHHTIWIKLFENLSFVVLDEVHQYRGVFGSHVANLIRRLRRLCKHYGSRPTFICSSASIGNARELAERLIGDDVTLIDQSGAPVAQKHVVFLNPRLSAPPAAVQSTMSRGQRPAAPVVKGPIQSPVGTLNRPASGAIAHDTYTNDSMFSVTIRVAMDLIANGIQTIVFGRTRLTVELLLSNLRMAAQQRGIPVNSIRGYRGGYLPSERRQIESELRSKKALCVVSTNALELGIDIGSMSAAVLCGYPGSIASTWQRMGRAGRRTQQSLAVLVAGWSPLDQFIVSRPDYFFERNPENGLINPDNLLILADQLKCATFELPFDSEERFGTDATADLLAYLHEINVLHRSGQRYYWMAEGFPAQSVKPRSMSGENFVIIDQTEGAKVIGEIDRYAARTLLHDHAIYIHEGQQYEVNRNDWDENKAYVSRVAVDYYTDAELQVNLDILHENQGEDSGPYRRALGDVRVRFMPSIFKKVKLLTGENVGSGPVNLPEEEVHSSGFWIAVGPEVVMRFAENELSQAMFGAANALVHVAPLHLMCDARDIFVSAHRRNPITKRPTIFIYERLPEAVGLVEKLFQQHQLLLATAAELIQTCICDAGCPSCVGPEEQVGPKGKRLALDLLSKLSDG